VRSQSSDRAAWADEQASLLGRQEPSRIDRENVAREIERLGAADIELLRERIRILLTALVRWAFDVDLRSMGLYITIMRQRNEIAGLLKESPSLASRTLEFLIETYPKARRAAAMESGPFEDAFPAGLPFLPGEVFDLSFLPDPLGDDLIRGAEWWRDR
jgi:hypothetical protein